MHLASHYFEKQKSIYFFYFTIFFSIFYHFVIQFYSSSATCNLLLFCVLGVKELPYHTSSWEMSLRLRRSDPAEAQFSGRCRVFVTCSEEMAETVSRPTETRRVSCSTRTGNRTRTGLWARRSELNPEGKKRDSLFLLSSSGEVFLSLEAKHLSDKVFW